MTWATFEQALQARGVEFASICHATKRREVIEQVLGGTVDPFLLAEVETEWEAHIAAADAQMTNSTGQPPPQPNVAPPHPSALEGMLDHIGLALMGLKCPYYDYTVVTATSTRSSSTVPLRGDLTTVTLRTSSHGGQGEGIPDAYASQRNFVSVFQHLEEHIATVWQVKDTVELLTARDQPSVLKAAFGSALGLELCRYQKVVSQLIAAAREREGAIQQSRPGSRSASTRSTQLPLPTWSSLCAQYLNPVLEWLQFIAELVFVVSQDKALRGFKVLSDLHRRLRYNDNHSVNASTQNASATSLQSDGAPYFDYHAIDTRMYLAVFWPYSDWTMSWLTLGSVGLRAGDNGQEFFVQEELDAEDEDEGDQSRRGGGGREAARFSTGAGFNQKRGGGTRYGSGVRPSHLLVYPITNAAGERSRTIVADLGKCPTFLRDLCQEVLHIGLYKTILGEGGGQTAIHQAASTRRDKHTTVGPIGLQEAAAARDPTAEAVFDEARYSSCQARLTAIVAATLSEHRLYNYALDLPRFAARLSAVHSASSRLVMLRLHHPKQNAMVRHFELFQRVVLNTQCDWDSTLLEQQGRLFKVLTDHQHAGRDGAQWSSSAKLLRALGNAIMQNTRVPVRAPPLIVLNPDQEIQMATLEKHHHHKAPSIEEGEELRLLLFECFQIRLDLDGLQLEYQPVSDPTLHLIYPASWCRRLSVLFRWFHRLRVVQHAVETTFDHFFRPRRAGSISGRSTSRDHTSQCFSFMVRRIVSALSGYFALCIDSTLQGFEEVFKNPFAAVRDDEHREADEVETESEVRARDEARTTQTLTALQTVEGTQEANEQLLEALLEKTVGEGDSLNPMVRAIVAAERLVDEVERSGGLISDESKKLWLQVNNALTQDSRLAPFVGY